MKLGGMRFSSAPVRSEFLAARQTDVVSINQVRSEVCVLSGSRRASRPDVVYIN